MGRIKPPESLLVHTPKSFSASVLTLQLSFQVHLQCWDETSPPLNFTTCCSNCSVILSLHTHVCIYVPIQENSQQCPLIFDLGGNGCFVLGIWRLLFTQLSPVEAFPLIFLVKQNH